MGLLARDGSTATPPRFDRVGRFAEGLCYVRIEDKFSLIDESLEPVCDLRCTDVHFSFASDLLTVEVSDCEYAYVRRDGTRAFERTYRYAFPFSGDRAVVAVPGADAFDRRYGVIDRNAEWVVRPEFDWINSFLFGEQVTSARQGEEWMLLDRDGQVVPEPGFTDLNHVASGLAAFRDCDLQYGVIDICGNIVVEAQYARCGSHYEDGYLGFERDDGGWSALDRQGKEALRTDHCFLGLYKNGLFCANQGGEWTPNFIEGGNYGFIDVSGRVVIDFQFASANWFDDELIAVDWPSPDEESPRPSGYLRADGSVIWRG